MNKKYFGTDGIRGTANQFPMTAEIALRVGMAVGARFGEKFSNNNHRHRVVIGKDTRLSGYLVETALTAGFTAVGMDVFLVGPVPTPAVSMLTKSMRADIGIMISASHNPYYDNGIKIFNKKGHKLSDEIELEIEKLIDGDITPYLAHANDLGRAKRLDDASNRYIEFVKSSFPKEQSLNDLKIVVDCANGAAYNIAPKILWELGAEVIEIGTKPDGFNINEDCGSTKPEKLCQKVIEKKADIGIALDGDADRILIVDEKGNIIDGDKLIAIIAEKLHDKGELKKDTVAITQMSNLALENYLNYIGVTISRTNVGDRYILAEMSKNGYNFGGEQSGHIVLSDYSTTGDGLVAALQVLSVICQKQKKTSEIFDIFESYPQILKNIRFNRGAKNPLEISEVQEFLNKKSQEIQDLDGRILVRKSGTENLIRVMVEAKKEQVIKEFSEEICKKIESYL